LKKTKKRKWCKEINISLTVVEKGKKPKLAE
jgi:hypothetical protein